MRETKVDELNLSNSGRHTSKNRKSWSLIVNSIMGTDFAIRKSHEFAEGTYRNGNCVRRKRYTVLFKIEAGIDFKRPEPEARLLQQK